MLTLGVCWLKGRKGFIQIHLTEQLLGIRNVAFRCFWVKHVYRVYTYLLSLVNSCKMVVKLTLGVCWLNSPRFS